ncbi:MerR family transcriptional regulator [Paenibacillus glycanilyticus]|uniref:MerR family transcriptional regulator n=1 Tax=Paenibacillus glycanilyticus TaxID=126569 RepID=A0ABQ6GMY2_9BACL|nr:MerR family transcriptional regulator [Paenibacillus glycanilyticus]GLX70706.1 MerR family transcriptional regulator [Paenibacillus glycanilyticus]
MKYTIKEVSQKLGMQTDTIRYYDKAGLLPNIERDNNGYRIFNGTDIYNLQMIQCFRSIGMSIEEMKKIMIMPLDDTRFSIEHREEIVKKQRDKLMQQKEQIDQALLLVEFKLSRYAEIKQSQANQT